MALDFPLRAEEHRKAADKEQKKARDLAIKALKESVMAGRAQEFANKQVCPYHVQILNLCDFRSIPKQHLSLKRFSGDAADMRMSP